MNESYNNIGKTKIGRIYLSALRSVLDVFEEAGSLLYSEQEIAVFKDYFLPAFHGGRKFNVRIAKILWLFCRYSIFFRFCTAAKQNQ